MCQRSNSLALSLSSSRDTGSVDEEERDLATGSVDVGRCVSNDEQTNYHSKACAEVAIMTGHCSYLSASNC